LTLIEVERELKNPFKGGSLKWKGLALGTTLMALFAVVFAFNVTWNAPVSLVVDNVNIKVYWDQNCTSPVTMIDFGKIEQTGAAYYAYMYIRNEGLGTVTLRWNSTLHFITDKIYDGWYTSGYYSLPVNGTQISHSAIIQTYYYVVPVQGVNPGSYSWTLYLGAEQ
jgi:hypothetical protein